MYITAYKRSGRYEPLFIFRFINEEDLECSTKLWLRHAETLEDEEDIKRFRELVGKIKTRADAQYATENSALSSSLFYDEFVRFSDYTAALLCCSTPSSVVDKSLKKVEDTRRLLDDSRSCVNQVVDIWGVVDLAQKESENSEETLEKIRTILVRNKDALESMLSHGA